MDGLAQAIFLGFGFFVFLLFVNPALAGLFGVGLVVGIVIAAANV